MSSMLILQRVRPRVTETYLWMREPSYWLHMIIIYCMLLSRPDNLRRSSTYFQVNVATSVLMVSLWSLLDLIVQVMLMINFKYGKRPFKDFEY